MAKKGSIAVQAEIKSVKMATGSYGPRKISLTVEFETPRATLANTWSEWLKGLYYDADAEALKKLRDGKQTASKKPAKKTDDVAISADNAKKIEELEKKLRVRYDAYVAKAQRETAKAMSGAQAFTVLSLLQGQHANVVISPAQQILAGFDGLSLEAPADGSDDGIDDGDNE